jgi:hypothetical protein
MDAVAQLLMGFYDRRPHPGEMRRLPAGGLVAAGDYERHRVAAATGLNQIKSVGVGGNQLGGFTFIRIAW